MPKTLKEALEVIKNPPLRDPYTGKPLTTDAYTKYRGLIKDIKSSKDVQQLLMEIIRQCKAEAVSCSIAAFIGGIVVGLEMGGIEDVASDGERRQEDTLQ